ncbi:UNVERIFIED_CONTAM: hypothetical protein FKN15_035232 [Acipenser sinensis]
MTSQYKQRRPDRGIPTVPGTVTLKKDPQNLIGISIGGGAQYCPCLYIVQSSYAGPLVSPASTDEPPWCILLSPAIR